VRATQLANKSDPSERGMTKQFACGSKEVNRPLSRFPLRGKAGAGGFPPRRKHAASQQKTLARIDAAGSPHKRAAAPLCIPRSHALGVFQNLCGEKNNRALGFKRPDRDGPRKENLRMAATSSLTFMTFS
jgi:hypothetical protein